MPISTKSLSGASTASNWISDYCASRSNTLTTVAISTTNINSFSFYFSTLIFCALWHQYDYNNGFECYFPNYLYNRTEKYDWPWQLNVPIYTCTLLCKDLAVVVPCSSHMYTYVKIAVEIKFCQPSPQFQPHNPHYIMPNIRLSLPHVPVFSPFFSHMP